ncbi:hypothetical protein BDN72DRAFT_883083 [Pluteus cervinus]|uniref:Uncharacterized protein n=1 Tax=Pluteus cervinus TaxID=181527 RepID=A0ACD3A8H5_9AGAR|nr:hypothetical protein BDN72DRAFT_883083 [Pluteus cervinus]
MTGIGNDRSQATLVVEEAPGLPLEIEYEIFVLAFYTDSKGQTTLLRVARRVSEWLIPLLYNVVTIYPESSRYRYPPSTSLKRYGHHTHHLCFNHANSSAILPLCPNAYNLAFWFDSERAPNVVNLPVKKVTFDDYWFLKKRPDTNDTRVVRWCSNITHLGLGRLFTVKVGQYLVHFPALEYLMILDFNEYGGLAVAWKCCPRLKVVVRLLGPVSHHDKTQVVHNTEGEDQDIRIVKMDGSFMSDWVRGAKGEGDMWELAEKEVERRRGTMV